MSKNRQFLSRFATVTVAALALLTFAPLLHAEGRTYTISSGAPNAVVFNIEDSVDPFDGKTANATGTITADPAAPSQAQVDVSIDLASLDTGVALRNQHMREKYLETAKFPAVTFKSVSVSAPASIAPNQPADVSITGDFTLHGVTKRMTIPVKVTLLADGRIHAISRFSIRLPDFGIVVPHNVFVTVDDSVKIRLDLFAK
jgi:polyisoprenoid-binding protein YceI